MHLDLKALILSFRVSKQRPCFTAIVETGGDKRLVELELTCEADGVVPLDPFQSGHYCNYGGSPDVDYY